MKVYYSPAYAAAGEAFDTTRKSAWIAESLADHPIPKVQLVEPVSMTAEQIAQRHTWEYVRAVREGKPRALATSNGFNWDPQMWTAVCAPNGGAMAAAHDALLNCRHAGSLSSGLHHARTEHAAGFCTFNGLALAAFRAVASDARVLILDLDAHFGGGTVSMISGGPDPRRRHSSIVHLDIAVSQVDGYNTPVFPDSADLVTRADHYLPTLARRLAALEHETFDLVIYNAGMDPYAIGGLAGITADVLAERERFVFDWAEAHNTPVAFVLAGGYSDGTVVDGDPETLLTTEREKAAYLAGLMTPEASGRSSALTSGSPSRAAGAFPATFPVGLDPGGRALVLYLATVPWTDDFRMFLQGTAAFLTVVPSWTLRLVFPRPLDRVYTAYQTVVREELETPLHRATIGELQWYFEHRQQAIGHGVHPQTQGFLDRAAKVFNTPRFTLLYRRWLKEGDAVFPAVSSPVFAEALARGSGRVECLVLSRTYRHLSPLGNVMRSAPQPIPSTGFAEDTF